MTLQLTPNHTVFEYDDSLNGDNIPYHPGYIRIDEIDLYVQYQYETINVNIRIIETLCEQLFDIIHNGDYSWVANQPYLPYGQTILSKIINRMKCVTNDYNNYDDYVILAINKQVRGYVDDEEYQLRLSVYIINTFINTIGLNETLKLFAKHYGDIVNYLFYGL